MNNLGSVYISAGKFDQALPLLEEALNRSKAELAPDHPGTLFCMSNLGMMYLKVGKLDLAVPLLEETLELTSTKVGRDDPQTLTCMGNLAAAYRGNQQLEQGTAVGRRNAQAHEGQARPGPSRHASEHEQPRGSLPRVTQVRPRPAAARRDARAPEGQARPGPPPHASEHEQSCRGILVDGTTRQVASLCSRRLLKRTGVEAGKGPPVHAHLRGEPGRELPGRRPTQGSDSAARRSPPSREKASRDSICRSLANRRLCSGRREPKLANLLKEWLTEARQNVVPNESPQLAQELASLSLMLLHAKAFPEAEPLLRECLAIRQRTQPDVWSTSNTPVHARRRTLGQKKYAEAEPLLLAGYGGMKQREKTIPADGWNRLTEALERLVTLFLATNKPDDAAKWRQGIG